MTPGEASLPGRLLGTASDTAVAAVTVVFPSIPCSMPEGCVIDATHLALGAYALIPHGYDTRRSRGN
jgi:hypothetical protein